MPPLSIAAWARKYIKLTTEMGVATPGKYDPDITPWVHAIFAAYTNRSRTGVVFVKPAQIGGSLTSQIIIAWVIDNDPSNILNFMDTADNARYASTKRIQPMIDAQDRLRHKVDPPRKRNKLSIGFDGGSLDLAGANSLSQLSNKSAPRVTRDEIGKWKAKLGAEAGALENAAQRTKGQYWHMMFDLSTPVMDGDPILKRYDISDKNQFYLPCPICGEYQTLKWDHVKWPHDSETGASCTPAEARDNSWYECEHCSGKITEGFKRWMNANGVAIRAGQTVNSYQLSVISKEATSKKTNSRSAKTTPVAGTARSNNGFGMAAEQLEKTEREAFGCLQEYVCSAGASSWSVTLPSGKIKKYKMAGSAPFNPIFGLHINRLYSVFEPWGVIAEEWLQVGSDTSKLQAFINSALAEPFKQKTVDVQTEAVISLIDRNLPLATVPDGFEFIVVGTDYHGLRYNVRYVAVAIDAAYRMAIIDYGETASLASLADRIGSPYANQAKTAEITADMVAVDAGYEATTIYDFCRQTPGAMPIFGRTGKTYRPTDIRPLDKYPDGRPMKGGMKIMMVNTDNWKDYIHNLMTLSWDGHGQYVRIADGVGADLIESLTSEKRIEKTDAAGRTTTTWRPKGSGKNHYWDCLVYATAMAKWWGPQIIAHRQQIKRKQIKPTRRDRDGRAGAYLDNMPDIS